MIKRVVEVGSDCDLKLSERQLMVYRGDELVGKAPLEDLGVLILDNARITYTLRLLQECAESGAAVVFCNEKHMPMGVMQPLAGHSLHSKTIAQQVEVTEPTKKRLWQVIVMGKLLAQASTLERAGRDGSELRARSYKVTSGDADNQESQGAAVYWKLLFGEGFRRNPDAQGLNSLLNYGYAVVRAAVARSVVGTGLHPALGLHHRSQYDALALADDLMEPFRPAVDLLVFRMAKKLRTLELTRDIKRELLTIFESRWELARKVQPFMVVVQMFAANVKNAMLEGRKKLEIPVQVEGENSGQDTHAQLEDQE